jgi:hypothetical protein
MLTEVQLQARLIRAFVRSEPITVELQRPRRVTTDSGGLRSDGFDLIPPQVFRLTPFKRRLTLEWGFTKEGERVHLVEWVLVGEPDADVQEGDEFTHQNYIYRVEFVSDHRLYRTAAGLSLRSQEGVNA